MKPLNYLLPDISYVMELTPEPTPQDIQIIREWIKQTPYIPQDFDDYVIRCFIVGKKGKLSDAKLCIESYCALGANFPEIFQNYDFERKQLQEYLSTAYFVYLKLTDGTIGVFTKFKPNFNPSKHHCLELWRCGILNSLNLIRKKEYGQGNFRFFVDCEGLSLESSKDLTPPTMSLLAKAFKNGFPLRIKSLIMFNVPNVVEFIFKTMKKLTTSKMTERLHIGGSSKLLKDEFPIEDLPNDYGGTRGTLEELNAKWMKEMSELRDYFIKEEERIRKLDALRPKSTDLADFETFKKLEVD